MPEQNPTKQKPPKQKQTSPYLSFSLGDRQYSLSTDYLEEIFLLPEVTLLSTASPDIIGILNFRGDILPILDPKISLGHTHTLPYQTSDSIIVLRQDQLRIGLIVGQIGAVENVSAADINTTAAALNEQQAKAQRPAMLAGLLQPHDPEENPHWLLNEPEQWLKYVDIQPLMAMQSLMAEQNFAARQSSEESGPSYSVFCPEATPAERAIFQQRAQNLQAAVESDRTANVTTLAIVTIEARMFGIDLLAVKEFAELTSITPIPCCPPHIVGNMNLRGDILTLVDLQPLLKAAMTPDGTPDGTPLAASTATPTAATTKKNKNASRLATAKAMVIEIEDYVVGVLINEVTEAMLTLHQNDLAPEQTPHAYFQGKFDYQGQSVSVLNLSHLVSESHFIVDEVV